jgi:multiple sugar transport system permease protein
MNSISQLRRKEELTAYLFLLPWIIGFVVFTAGPIIASIYLSLTSYDLFSSPKFVGLSNFKEMFFKDKLFWHSLKVTTIYSVVSVPLHIAIGYTLALLLNQRIKGLAWFRTIYYMPAVVSGVSVAILFQWIFNPELGLVNAILSKFGIQGPRWFASVQWALPTFIIMSLWSVGGGIVIYLAGFQGIPTELYESAELDGAGGLEKLRYITIPLTTPVIFLQLIMGIIGSFQVFTQAYVITAGGPANATLFYVLYLYQNGWQFFRMGYASALAWVLFAIIVTLTLVIFRTSGRWVYYAGMPR